MPSYDVFLSYNAADKPAVEEIARRLRRVGIDPWLDHWNLIPGEPWQEAIEVALGQCATCAVFVGPSGVGPWQNKEMLVALERRSKAGRKDFRIVPVLLPGAERGERNRLPLFLTNVTWVEFRHGLDDERAFHRLVAGIRGAAPGPGPDQILQTGVTPYRGLQTFDVADSPFFFGREALTERLLDGLRSEEIRFTAILGPSGSGKSSLARAGVLAALKQGWLPGSEQWPIVICKPGSEPLISLAIALSQVTGGESNPGTLRDLQSNLLSSPKTLHLFTRVALRDAPSDRRVVVLVDQFEETFTLCSDEALRQAFFDNLVYAATAEGGQTIILVTLRTEFYANVAAYPQLAEVLSNHQVLVGPMARDELMQAILSPAATAGYEVERGLVELLLNEVADQPGSLPLLQNALLELWQQRSGRRLTIDAYHSIGRVAGALDRRAETVFASFNDLERGICRRIFLRLIQVDDRGVAVARRISLPELLSSGDEKAIVSSLIREMTDARLLTTERTAGDVVEVGIAHEALVTSWPRFQDWIEEERSALQFRRRLSEAALEWEWNGHDPSYLFAGTRLDQAVEFLKTHPSHLNELERSFINASRLPKGLRWSLSRIRFLREMWKGIETAWTARRSTLETTLETLSAEEAEPSLSEQLETILSALPQKAELSEDDLRALVDLFTRCTAQKATVAGLPTDHEGLRSVPLKVEIDWGGLPLREIMPLIVPQRTSTASNVQALRGLIGKVPGSPSVTLMITLLEGAAAREFTEAIKSEISPYAYDVVVLKPADLRSLAVSAEPERILRRLILSQVNLIPVSPFKTEGPVSLARFFGREWELRQVRENIDTKSFVVIGGRRIGKTSLLYRLRTSDLPRDNFYTLYLDCSIFSGVAELKAAPAHDWVPRSPDPGLRTFGDVLAARPTDSRIVLFLDEADKLVPMDRANGWPFFNELRAMVNGGRVRVVMAGERILRKALRDPEGPLFNFADEIRLGPLDFGAVRELVTQPMHQLEIEVVKPQEVLGLIWALTSGHPNVVQRLCERLIKKLNRESRRQIGLEDVNAVAEDPEFLREDFLDTYWERATPLEKIVSLLMADDPELRTRKAIRQALEKRCHLQPTAAEVEETLQNLIELRSILKRTPAGYEINVPAFPRVIARTITLEDMLEDFVEAYQEQKP